MNIQEKKYVGKICRDCGYSYLTKIGTWYCNYHERPTKPGDSCRIAKFGPICVI